jgi:hypothetical protein
MTRAALVQDRRFEAVTRESAPAGAETGRRLRRGGGAGPETPSYTQQASR